MKEGTFKMLQFRTDSKNTKEAALPDCLWGSEWGRNPSKKSQKDNLSYVNALNVVLRFEVGS